MTDAVQMRIWEDECAPSTSLPAQEVGSSLTSSSAIPPCAPSSGTPTAARSYASDATRDGGPSCTCTRETSGCGIHPRGRDEWIACMRDSLAKTSARMARGQEYVTELDPVCGERLSAWPLHFVRASYSWRTAQESLAADSTSYAATWPRSGMMRNGVCSPLPMWVRLISESGGSAWRGIPTLVASDARGSGSRNTSGSRAHPGISLTDWLRGDGGTGRLLPTLHASQFWQTNSNKPNPTPTLMGMTRGQLNPAWAEWFMGFPIGATALKDSETHRSPSKRRSRGSRSAAPPPPAGA